MEIIKIPEMNELKEFANKYPFAVKELKNNVIELVKFDTFINSNEWNSLNDNERFIFLDTLLMFNMTDNILQNHVISINDNNKVSIWNYGEYEDLIIDYSDRRPIDINEFAKEYPVIINKVENEVIFLKDYDEVLISDSWQNLSYKKQYELLNKLLSNLIDENIKKRKLKNDKRKQKKLKYNLPEVKVNCNYVSEKWNVLFEKYWWFDTDTLKNDKPETKEEQITYFGNEYYKLLKENSPEAKGLITKILDILINLGADEKIKFIESRFKKESNSKNNSCILLNPDYNNLHPELVMKKDLSDFCTLCFSDLVKLKDVTFEKLPDKCLLKDELINIHKNVIDDFEFFESNNLIEQVINYCNEKINNANEIISSRIIKDRNKLLYRGGQKQFADNKIYLCWLESLKFHNEKLNELQASSIEQPKQQIQHEKEETKETILKKFFVKYNFFELEKIKLLNNENQNKLLEFIYSNDLPYKIAMLEYLDFFKKLMKERFNTKVELYKEVANWFNVTTRQIKGNILVLNDYSKENRSRYTAHEYKQNVINDYQKLK